MIKLIDSHAHYDDKRFDEEFEGGADAALAASLFHFKELEIREVKEYLHGCGIPVRL